MQNYRNLVKNIVIAGATRVEGVRYLQEQSLNFDLSGGTFPLESNGAFHLKEVVEGLHAFLGSKKENTPINPLVCTDICDLTLNEMMDALVACGKGKEALEAMEPFRLHAGLELSRVASTEEMRHGFESQYAAAAKNVLYQLLCTYGLLAQAEGTRVVDRVNALIKQFRQTPDSRGTFVVAWAPSESDGGEADRPVNHSLFKFYTTELSMGERISLAARDVQMRVNTILMTDNDAEVAHALRMLTEAGVPTHKLNCEFHRHTADVYKEAPMDIARYALLTCAMARLTRMQAGEFAWSAGTAYLEDSDMGDVDAMMSSELQVPQSLWLNSAIDVISLLSLDDVDLFVA